MNTNKPTLTICVLAKAEICALTVSSLFEIMNNPDIGKIVNLRQTFAIGTSDLPKTRSEQLTNWYNTAVNGDYFLFIDADQTFKSYDLFTSLIHIQTYDIVCGAYSRKDGTPTVEAKDINEFYQNKSGELWYGSTGFMMVSYPIVDKLVRFFGRQTKISLQAAAYPFFYERIIDEPELNRKELWLSEDYSFCWLARQHGGRVYGYIASIGHIIPKECMVEMPDRETWGGNSIVYYCGPTAEAWSPKTLTERGLGGSETAVIRLAPFWVKMGYKVNVFCNCDAPGVYDGVQYNHHQAFNFIDNFNILIVWRGLEQLNMLTVKAKICIVDLHDIVEDVQFTDKVLKNVNYFCVKSNYHAGMLTKVDKNKIVVIPNGGAYETNFEKVEKDCNYLIYASSYDRGLPYMLKWGWPKIKKACPDAYLHIYYGWEGFDKIAAKNPDSKLYKDITVKLMQQDGVKEMGRIPQQQLLREKMKANIHYYVGDFQEIDCISVRESACLGAIPIVSKAVKVFEEKNYCVCIDGDPHKQSTHEDAAEKIIELIQKPKVADKLRKNLVVPQNETWEKTAEKWVKLFLK